MQTNDSALETSRTQEGILLAAATAAPSEGTYAETEAENPVTAVAGQFGLDGQIFAAQLLNFLIVLVILWIFVYKPVVRLLDERQEKIEKSVQKADEIDRRLKAVEEERAEMMTAAKREAALIAEKANKDSEARRQEMIDAAKREVERVIAKGKQQLAQEKEEMLKTMRKDVVDIAMKAAARILQNEVDEKKSQSLAEEVVRKMT